MGTKEKYNLWAMAECIYWSWQYLNDIEAFKLYFYFFKPFSCLISTQFIHESHYYWCTGTKSFMFLVVFFFTFGLFSSQSILVHDTEVGLTVQYIQ